MESFKIQRVDDRFQKACGWLLKLNDQIKQLETRYTRAGSKGQASFRYNQRLRLCVLEGMKDVCYQYAHQMALQLDDLRRQAGYIVVGGDEQEE